MRNYRERQGFAKADAIRRFVKVDPAGRADTLDVRAERHDIEVGFEQLPLGVARFQPARQRDLAQLAGRCLRVQAVRQPRELHRQGRSTLARAPGVRPKGRTTEGDRVHTEVPVEPSVLLEQERIDKRGRNLLQWHPHAVLIVR